MTAQRGGESFVVQASALLLLLLVLPLLLAVEGIACSECGRAAR